MRIDQIVIKDILRFRGETTIDLRAIDPGLIALVGPNGAGKTSLLEVVPGTVYRKLPSRRDGADPAVFARSREAALDVTFAIDGQGTFRARVSIDGQTRSSDAVLEHLRPNGSWIPLNDGKVTTYKKVIAERFPSLELFLTSAFAAQGKGDRLARMTSGEGQDLFAEFLGLQRYAVLSKTAKQAADRLEAARGRLLATRDVLARDTAEGIAEELERLADDLQRTGGDAELRRVTLTEQLATLAARLATVQDQVSAYTAATQRIATLERELTGRQTERAGVDRQRTQVAATLVEEQRRLTATRDRETAAAKATRDAAVADAATKIAGNHTIQGKADAIREAVLVRQALDAELPVARQALEAEQQAHAAAAEQRRTAERALAALVPVDDRLARARNDAEVISTVPCGGVEPYAACRFLLNATEAAGRIAALEAELGPKAALADRVGTLTRDLTALDARVRDAQARVKILEGARAQHQTLAQYDTALAQSTERVQQLEALQVKARTDAATIVAKLAADHARLSAEAGERHDGRMAELAAEAERLDAAIDRLSADLTTARHDLADHADGHEQATTLLRDQERTRREWDEVTAAIARVDSGRRELDRRRRELAEKRTRLGDVERRLALVDAELVEWQTLAKIFGRDGLPDLEIDAAGPTISATTNEILNHCFGPRFTVEIVTQVAKADGKGVKDEFSIRVLDNDEGGDWRDLSDLSGGEKVIVCEALMNAIAVYVNTRSPMPIRTLWRDETGSSLDPENAVRYVEMLRKVRELGGIHHVFFISHNADAASLADAQIRVSHGQAALVLPPYGQEAA